MSTRAISSFAFTFVVLSCLVCASRLSAQTDTAAPPAQGQPAAQEPGATLTIRQTVRRVILDVTVRDADGKPVHNLAAGDFSIAEDKQPVNILSFDVYDFDKPSLSRGPNAPPLPPNVFVNVPSAPEHGPLYVILDDLVNTEMEDQMTARQQILKFISSKPAGTRFAVFVTSDKLYLVQGFTDDKDLLYAALDPKHPKAHVPRIFLLGTNYGRGDPYTAIDMLSHVGQYLDGIPGRKNLIWVAGKFPLAIAAEEADSSYWAADVRSEMNALAQAQVAVFPVNARGVVTNPEGALTGARPNGGASNMSDPTAANAPNSSSLSNPTNGPITAGMLLAGHGGSLNSDFAAADTIASATGGRAFYSTNDLKEALSEATEDGGNYYTLTYAPPPQFDDGKCHNIVVRVDKAKYQLSYRRYYCRVPLVSSPAEEKAESTETAALALPLQAGDVLQANIRPGAPMLHDLVFSAHVRTDGAAAMATPAQMDQLQQQGAYFRPRKNKPVKPLPPVKVQTYLVDYRVLDPRLKAQATQSGKPATLEFAIAAFDRDGKVQNGVVNDAVLDASTQAADNKAGVYRVRQSLIVPASAISIRVGVRDRASDRMGTLEVQLPLAPEPVAKSTAPAH